MTSAVASSQTFVIVGASLAGANAAQALRSEGFDGRVILVGEEAERPYERPPLSKEHLRGQDEPGSIFVHPEAFYAEQGIELRSSTRVAALHPGDRRVETADGEAIGYDRLLLATGAQPRRMDVPGSDLGGIHYLRTVQDSDRLRAALAPASRLAVVGAGWIGSEVAASARQLGVEVVLIDPMATPLERALGPEVGAVYRDLHARHGVELHPNTSVGAFVGNHSVEGVRTADGDVFDVDLVVAGIGVEPRTGLAATAGLALDNGIAVDEYLQTSAPGIYAAGDVAAAWHPGLGRRIRVEHWANAVNQGIVAAKNMLGAATVYDRVPYFFSDQYDLGMEYAGYTTSWDEVVFRGDPATGEFIAFWLGDGRVLAGMNANTWGVNKAIQELIRSRKPVPLDRLADPAVPLAELVRAATPGGTNRD
ncbi:MAG: NAD(P)/FAD-dependent oxidoreductase [Acidimicrobiales bacterium]